MSENLEVFYDIKAMFTDAFKNPQFTSYATGTINTLLGRVLEITGFDFNYMNRFFEITVVGEDEPLGVVGRIKNVLGQFVYSCTAVEEISNILHMINADTYNKLYVMVKDQDQAELFKIVNYMYSILFLGNIPTGHLFRIMM